MSKEKKSILLTLFLSTMRISAFTFGGGYVIVPLMRKHFVEELAWIDEEEMLDLIAIAQSSPGPIAINASIIIGYRMHGVIGALVTMFGTILPPFLIIVLVSMVYKEIRDNSYVNAIMQGMQAGVAVLIVNAVISMGKTALKRNRIFSLILMLGVFIAIFCFKVSVVWILLISGLAGFLHGHYLVRELEEKDKAEDMEAKS